MKILRLHEAVAAVCPITRVAVVDAAAKQAVFDAADGASEQQIAAANNVIATFDWSQAAEDAWTAASKPDRAAIRQAATQAIADNDSFIALPTPTNAQTVAQVRKLCQQNSRIIKRLVQID